MDHYQISQVDAERKPFKYQVAGHRNLHELSIPFENIPKPIQIFHSIPSDSFVNVIIKPTNLQEIQFYIDAYSDNFNPKFYSWIPKFYGWISNSGSFLMGDSQKNPYLLLLENLVVRPITQPTQPTDIFDTCLMDMKIGTRQYSDDASPVKKNRMINLINTTTSRLCGLRITGIHTNVFDEGSRKFIKRYVQKAEGKSLKTTEELTSMVQLYLNGFTCSSSKYQVLKYFIERIDSLMEIIRTIPGLRLYSSSLLFIYSPDSKFEPRVILIDFAHCYISKESYSPHEGGEGVIDGLRNLRIILTK